MPTNALTVDPRTSRFQLTDIDGATSSEVSRLLLGAMTCIERDEASAIDLVRKASSLLGAQGNGNGTGARVASGGLARWQIKRVEAHIEDRISHSISVDELARLANLSTSYFSTAFKVSFGVSPHTYVVRRRVEHAKARMLETNAPLCEIALDCGMADQAHLSRVFRRMTGATPSAWRRHRLLAKPAQASETAETALRTV
ncbi:Bacillibactin transport regulator [Hartmannibacter diazotrophicus]|uniref:Bacillibactin transport regulator n=1 Tax=Hartmannibacter diazotrophicus TaxID=1482074 RepID=A0A2C9D1H1_9HYPH|nr:AraC family transcriptional regulator [Hartmannibacter diazotrophicus]SON54008.1 Bacillibactin transport regulator [Hartmannibacter diazotrophicus]